MEVDYNEEPQVVGPLNERAMLQDCIKMQVRLDRANELPHRLRLCAELRDVNRRHRNSTISLRFLGAMLGDLLGQPDWYRFMKPSYVKCLYNTKTHY